MKTLVTKRKARKRHRRYALSAPQRQTTLTRQGDSYKATGTVTAEKDIVMRTDATSLSVREQLTIEIIDNLTLALGRRPLVGQAATVIVDAYYSDMAAGDRVLKIQYTLEFCGLSIDLLPDEMRKFVTCFRPCGRLTMKTNPLGQDPSGRRAA